MTTLKHDLDKAAEERKAHHKLNAATEATLSYKRREEDLRALRTNIFNFLTLPTLRLREKISLLATVNVFFLINVDSYTRDDLMSMLAVKLSSCIMGSKLFLDPASSEGLAYLFHSLHITKDTMHSLEDPENTIYASIRTGEWILSDEEYRRFRGMDVHKNAEPLTAIVKSLTILQTNRFHAEESLALLSRLLLP